MGTSPVVEEAVRRSAFLLVWHSNYSAMLSKMHSYRLLFRRFCPLVYYVHQNSEFTTDTTLQSCDLVSRYHLELYYFGTSCPQNSIAYQKGGFLINSVNYLSFTKIFWHFSPSKLLPIFVNVIFVIFSFLKVTRNS